MYIAIYIRCYLGTLFYIRMYFILIHVCMYFILIQYVPSFFITPTITIKQCIAIYCNNYIARPIGN